MAEYTKYLRLMKPQGNEYYNVENFNHNAELIDKETEKLNTAVTKIQEGATREKAGIVQYGTTEGKALEGMMLARIFGCVGYGGDIQTAGVKDINYLYYDRNTRKMYKCINQNSDVSASVANFVPLDNNSLFERLENFSRFYEYNFNISGLTFGRITKIANIVTLTIDSGSAFLNKPNGSSVLNIPEGFRPKKAVYFSAHYLNSNKGGVFRIDPNGSIAKCHDDDNVGAYYFSVTYPID